MNDDNILADSQDMGGDEEEMVTPGSMPVGDHDDTDKEEDEMLDKTDTDEEDGEEWDNPVSDEDDDEDYEDEE